MDEIFAPSTVLVRCPAVLINASCMICRLSTGSVS